jgi:hypothetical protein
MSVWEYAREKFGIPLLKQQAKQLLRIYGIPAEKYELANAIEHSYTSSDAAMEAWTTRSEFGESFRPFARVPGPT